MLFYVLVSFLLDIQWLHQKKARFLDWQKICLLEIIKLCRYDIFLCNLWAILSQTRLESTFPTFFHHKQYLSINEKSREKRLNICTAKAIKFGGNLDKNWDSLRIRNRSKGKVILKNSHSNTDIKREKMTSTLSRAHKKFYISISLLAISFSCLKKAKLCWL